MKERFILRKVYEQYGWYRRSFEFTALVPLEKSDGAGAFLFTEKPDLALWKGRKNMTITPDCNTILKLA